MSLKQILNPTSFRTNIRSKFIVIIPNEKICNNLEIAIYNYAIREATQKKIIKKFLIIFKNFNTFGQILKIYP